MIASTYRPEAAMSSVPNPDPVTLFLCGDVMTGRGIDQRLPHPGDPTLHEPWVKDARTYVRIAEEASGEIPRPMSFSYPWGFALEELGRVDPAVRIVNLETAVTLDGEPWPGKGIHYRMNPANVAVLPAAGIDVCTLANNHVLDWGYEGLEQTLETLSDAGIAVSGAGKNRAAAQAPAAVAAGSGRVLVFGLGARSSGIPAAWAAAENRPGVELLPEPPARAVPEIAARVASHRREGDLVVASIHWGGNWGYRIPEDQVELARRLLDEAGVDLVHGHSSHHVKGIEVHRGKLILYGCGDFFTDYEGISGHEEFRGDLSLMYFPCLEPATGKLIGMEMTPTRMRRFRIQRASEQEARWLADVLDREGEGLGTSVAITDTGRLRLHWQTKAA